MQCSSGQRTAHKPHRPPKRPSTTEQPSARSPSAQGKDPSWAVWRELQIMSAWPARKDTCLQPPDFTFGHLPSAAPRNISFALFAKDPQTGETTGLHCKLKGKGSTSRQDHTFKGAQLQGPFSSCKYAFPSRTDSTSLGCSEIVTDSFPLCPACITYQNQPVAFPSYFRRL